MNKLTYIISIFVYLIFFNSSISAHKSIAKINTIENIEIREEKESKYYWIIYDNVCPYCKASKKHIKDLDWEGKFKFLSYRDPLTYKKFPFLSKEECKKDVHMVTPKGEVIVGYQVFRTVIDNLTATKILNPLLKNNFAEQKLTEIYEKMVKERSCYYNKTDTCGLKNSKTH